MKILALELSSPRRSVAVLEHPPAEEARVLAEAVSSEPPMLSAVALIEQALEQARTARETIHRLAVGLGPGSYTGIRAALAVAQGWQLAAPVRVRGLSSVTCLAARAWRNGWWGEVHAVIDGQRGEIYWATYAVTVAGWREVAPLRLAPIAAAQRAIPHEAYVVGPEADQWFPQARVLFPEAALLGSLAAQEGEEDRAAALLEPIYLRPTSFVPAPPPRPL